MSAISRKTISTCASFSLLFSSSVTTVLKRTTTARTSQFLSKLLVFHHHRNLDEALTFCNCIKLSKALQERDDVTCVLHIIATGLWSISSFLKLFVSLLPLLIAMVDILCVGRMTILGPGLVCHSKQLVGASLEDFGLG